MKEQHIKNKEHSYSGTEGEVDNLGQIMVGIGLVVLSMQKLSSEDKKILEDLF